MSKPRILILTGAVPYPLVTGAKIRTFNLMKALAGEFDIELLTVLGSPEDKEYIEKIEAAGIKCHFLTRLRAGSKVSKGVDALKSFILPEPYLTRHYTFSEYRKQLEALLANDPYDVIHCDSISMTGNLRGLDKKKLILTQHNIEQIIWKGYADHASGLLAKAFYGNQYRKVKHIEETLGEFYSYIITVSEIDKLTLGNHFNSDNIIVVDNGVDPEQYTNNVGLEDRSGVIFTGSLDWHPNIDGLRWFADEIYPELASSMPECRTNIVGRKPSPALVEAFGGKTGIELHSDVPEIQPYLHSARVMMVPLRIGGGSRLKILEAMASGIPVVSTSKGAEGLAVSAGENIIIEDNPKRFAEALVQVMQDESLYSKLSQEGLELIEKRYSWQMVSRPLAELWKKMSNA